MAYANSDIRRGGSGCVMWFGDLIDLRQLQQGGQELYIRTDASELEPQTGSTKNQTTVVASKKNKSKKNKRTILVTVIPAICLMVILCIIYLIHRVLRNDAVKAKTEDDIELETHVDAQDLPLFDLQTITTSTSNFSIENKIGKGGFGLVYKGKLVDGQEIAVKRLSKSSGQGINEFLNEAILIVKLQHRNLVRLLGCCIQGHERLLVYEYMVNGSLDSFIFDPTKGKLLKWPKRFMIISGIARGLLYLHQDSRLRIIHRDLKASNVLLDDELNPKISDFGMAKAFGGDQTEGNTIRVVGTYGYMAPEYAVEGLFSIKSDVFSFGVLLLEVISGNKNRALYHATDAVNLVGYAWTLWKEDKVLQLIDSNIRDSCVASEVLRCIHVSLLCVQQCPEDRPNMTLALRMLENEMELVEPKEPGFFPRKVSNEADLLEKQNEMSSNYNELTITSLSGR
ncbi:hypothetical protein RIF29_31125 [Crotalaria pallida]|uniref:non-specific serine/threonine protein kinase n=1 Tax=Crotalaria pallida TaxID=3830 RepID=A0AAN9HXD7_CROPI